MPNATHPQKLALPLFLLIITLMFSAVNMRSPIVMVGSVAPTLTDALGLSVSAIGLLGSLPMPMFAFGALVAPMLAKRFGLETVMLASTAFWHWACCLGCGLGWVGCLVVRLFCRLPLDS